MLYSSGMARRPACEAGMTKKKLVLILTRFINQFVYLFIYYVVICDEKGSRASLGYFLYILVVYLLLRVSLTISFCVVEERRGEWIDIQSLDKYGFISSVLQFAFSGISWVSATGEN